MSSVKLIEILPSDPRIKVVGDYSQQVRGITQDSRSCKNGYAFVAIKGLQVDGHNYIDVAIKKGAKVIFCEVLPSDLTADVSYVVWQDARKGFAEMVLKFYDEPSKKIKLIGVTGTNGKSTIVSLLYQLFSNMGYKAGLISTMKYCYGQYTEVASHTTPDLLKLNQLLVQMIESGCEYVFMEVSSHGIAQGRIDGLAFDIAVFTNISQDHLDYHKTYKDYIYTKKKFFDNLTSDAVAIINTDDKQSDVMVQNSQAVIRSYALRKMADYKAKVISNQIEGLHVRINNIELYTRLRGEYNAYNMLAAYGVMDVLGIDTTLSLQALSSVEGVEGRFEVIYNQENHKSGIIDYAHTPDAVAKLLQNVNEIKPHKSKVITVLGCGGDRDRSKRPLMANVASKYSDILIMTSDNPRSEDPEVILDEMQEGVTISDNILRITDRRQAIKTAVLLARSGDVVVVAGKGHEKYQEIKGKKLPFDDKEILTSTML